MEEEITAFEGQWTLEAALQVLAHPTVDSRTWAEAVEWLLLHGPPEIKALVQEASGYATGKEFPDLQVQGVSGEGEPVYAIADLARALNIDEEEASAALSRQEDRHGVRQRMGDEDVLRRQ